MCFFLFQHLGTFRQDLHHILRLKEDTTSRLLQRIHHHRALCMDLYQHRRFQMHHHVCIFVTYTTMLICDNSLTNKLHTFTEYSTPLLAKVLSLYAKKVLEAEISLQIKDVLPINYTVLFGSFSLSTKEPYTIMNCPSCIVLRRWCQHWHQHLCTPPPGTGLDIETSYLVHICTYIPHICTSNIK